MIDINGKTQKYGLFGYPVEHTASPTMHNAAFESSGLNAVYLPFAVHPDNLEVAVRSLVPLNIKGINVTIPHKQTIIPYLDDLSEIAEVIGAVNTVQIEKGRLIGHNTDGSGFLTALEEEAGFTVDGKKVFLAGAGGAGFAVATNCVFQGVSCLGVFDMDATRSQSLVDKLKELKYHCDIVNLAGLAPDQVDQFLSTADLAVNATPVGMKQDDPVPFAVKPLKEKALVYDLVYNIPKTTLIKEAEARGIRAYSGLSMLLYQGVLAFEIWTLTQSPVDVMRAALKRAVYGDTE
ncbi:MAG: shikimate dehydrogenase [Candidatus Auribacterota bacterium]|jgi:shikimate dehydrogenase|nr:shikimate dehydrogenase [Candidatus Auribacterota bacterium]